MVPLASVLTPPARLPEIVTPFRSSVKLPELLYLIASSILASLKIPAVVAVKIPCDWPGSNDGFVKLPATATPAPVQPVGTALSVPFQPARSILLSVPLSMV